MAEYTLDKLVSIMNELREKCPWDRKQTINTLRYLTIEECYELTDAIDNEDWQGIKEELGDLLLHIVFYTKIGSEKNQFTLDDVIAGISEKLIRRHPHIYGDTAKEGLASVNTEEDVKQNWEKIKMNEGKKSILAGVPKSLPSVVKSLRLQEKTKAVGFEWETTDQVWKKVDEELAELREAVASGDASKTEDETGDVLFSLINLARFLQVDPDAALEHTNRKFIRRFTRLEEIAAADGRDLHSMSLQEMDAIWDAVKLEERQQL